MTEIAGSTDLDCQELVKELLFKLLNGGMNAVMSTTLSMENINVQYVDGGQSIIIMEHRHQMFASSKIRASVITFNG